MEVNNNIVCPQCSSIFPDGIRSQYIKVSVGGLIPRQDFKKRTCDNLEEHNRRCLIKSLLARAAFINNNIANESLALNEELYKVSKEIFRKYNVQTADYLVRINSHKNGLNLDEEYTFNLVVQNRKYTNIKFNFVNNYNEGFILLDIPFTFNIEGACFDLFDGEILVISGIFM